MREAKREWEGGRELSATLANHLIGCHTELTLNEKERWERERQGERDWICSKCAVESAALINASVYPSAPHGLIASMISTHPSPPPPCSIPYLLSVSLSLSLSCPERRAGKDRDERKEKKYSRGRAREGRLSAQDRGGGWEEQSKGITAKDRERENLRCLIYSLSCCRQICEFGERQVYGEKHTEGRT